MPKLHQIIPIVTGRKSDAEKALTAAYHTLKKPEPFIGLMRSYSPFGDLESDKLPEEKKYVQTNVFKEYEGVKNQVNALLKIVAAQERSNCGALTDVVVDGQTILSQIPATYCLFLEKKLADLTTFISHIPTLDAAQKWTYDEDLEAYRAAERTTTHLKKLPKVITLAEPTDKHPAQTQLLQEDKIIGNWTNIALSGAIPAKMKNELKERVGKLLEAVVTAREKANSVEVVDVDTSKVLDYVFAPLHP